MPRCSLVVHLVVLLLFVGPAVEAHAQDSFPHPIEEFSLVHGAYLQEAHEVQLTATTVASASSFNGYEAEVEYGLTANTEVSGSVENESWIEEDAGIELSVGAMHRLWSTHRAALLVGGSMQFGFSDHSLTAEPVLAAGVSAGKSQFHFSFEAQAGHERPEYSASAAWLHKVGPVVPTIEFFVREAETRRFWTAPGITFPVNRSLQMMMAVPCRISREDPSASFMMKLIFEKQEEESY